MIVKARKLAPYVLLIIPASYFLGAIGIRFQDVQPESAFNGRYIMAVYLSISVLTAFYYFAVSVLSRSKAPLIETGQV